jgi:shikimate kinase
MIIFLVGYAGSGKSSLGKRLARRMGLRFVDTDNVVEQQVGAPIADIFHYEGEEYFRIAERRAVEGLANEAMDLVIATGGGLPTWRDNMEWMLRSGIVIYLRRSPEQILSRLSDYGRMKRPMFRGKSDEELITFMREQMAERDRYYTQAHIEVDCTTMSDDDVVEYIVNNRL